MITGISTSFDGRNQRMGPDGHLQERLELSCIANVRFRIGRLSKSLASIRGSWSSRTICPPILIRREVNEISSNNSMSDKYPDEYLKIKAISKLPSVSLGLWLASTLGSRPTMYSLKSSRFRLTAKSLIPGLESTATTSALN